MTDGPTQPRINPVDHDGAGAPPLNIFRTLAHNNDLYRAFLGLGTHLLRGGVLPERQRELVILRVGWRAGSEYEFGQHTAIGRAAGLTPEEVTQTTSDDLSQWHPDDAALLRMVDELCADNVVLESTWRTLASRWGDAEILELLALVGYYRLVSGLLNSVGVALEPATAGWPEDAPPNRRAPRET